MREAAGRRAVKQRNRGGAGKSQTGLNMCSNMVSCIIDESWPQDEIRMKNSEVKTHDRMLRKKDISTLSFKLFKCVFIFI